MSLYKEKLIEIGEYGEVVGVVHPIVSIVGLPNIKSNEIVVFDDDKLGQVQTMSKDILTVMVFSQTPVKVGQRVTRINDVFKLNLSQDLLGKVIDATGNILNNLTESTEPSVITHSSTHIDKLSPSMDLRLSSKDQFFTGISLVDLLIPIGFGQRELIVGDRKTGKTSFLLTMLKNHVKNNGVVVYVSIGSNISETKNIQNFIKSNHLSSGVTLVSTTSDSPHAHVLMSPFIGMSLAEYFKELGKHVLLVFDNLSTHAMYYREVSILSRRFPGRDSYPGDIFYLHARLLERAGNFLSNGNELGSITCFPVVQTVQNDLSDYIVSNLISITDGHILFDTNEFSKGRRPAVNISLSVTRLGRQTQSVLLQDVNRQFSSFLTSKYEKSLQLSHFGSELTEGVQRDLEVGNDMYSFFNQSTGVIVAIQPALVFSGMVWLDMFRGEFLTKIVVFRDIFAQRYTEDKEAKDKIDNILSAQDLKNMLIGIIGEKDSLLELCKVKKV